MSNLSLEEQHAIREAAGWYPWRSEGTGQPDTITGEVVALDSVWSDYRDELRILAVQLDRPRTHKSPPASRPRGSHVIARPSQGERLP